MFNLNHNLPLPKITFDNPFTYAKRAARQEKRMSEKNMKLINEFLTERKKEDNYLTTVLTRLEEQHKNKSIDKSTYTRIQEVMLLSHEIKKIEILDSVTAKSTKKRSSNEKTLAQKENPEENNQPS